MPLAPHQQKLLDLCSDLDPRDVPRDWQSAADLDDQIHRNRQKRLAQKEAIKAKPVPVRQRGTHVSRKELLKIVEEIAAAIAGLGRQVAELEGERMKFVGVWKRGQAYRKGSFATHQGSGWHCNADTTREPGKSPDWVLAVKRGRDGKDGNDGKEPSRKMLHAVA